MSSVYDMEALAITESRFYQDNGGNVYAANPALGYPYWTRYLDVFPSVLITGRIQNVDRVPEQARVASGPGVSFLGLPFWSGPWQFFRYHRELRRVAGRAVNGRSVCMRAPSQLSTLVAETIRDSGYPYAIEAVGDPWGFSPGSVNRYIAPLVRWKTGKDMKQLCGQASVATYVTRYTLQNQYPPSSDAFSTWFTDLILHDEDYVVRAKDGFETPFRIIHVGSMGPVLYKAQDIILSAFKIILEQFPEAELVLVGDGVRRIQLQEMSMQLGISNQVVFTGLLPGLKTVFAELDQSDLFILPSLQEGLPKALVEAMARGLPAIGSNVGGIPELLDFESLVEPGNVESLARKLVDMLSDPERMKSQADRNLLVAREYHIDKIRPRRIAFYEAIREITAKHLLKAVID